MFGSARTGNSRGWHQLASFGTPKASIAITVAFALSLAYLAFFVPAAQPQPGRLAAACDPGSSDVLRVAVASFGNDTMDSALETRDTTLNLLLPMYDTLIELGPKTTYAPGLATSWKISSSGAYWTFTLRKGVRFQDGEPLTAEDVVFSIGREMNPLATSTASAGLLQMVKQVVAVNAHTVRVITNGVQAELPEIFASRESNVVIWPKAYVLKNAGSDFKAQTALLGSKPVGTGPYKFVTRSRGDCILYSAVPNYRGWRSKPAFKYLEIFLVSDAATQMAMLRSGQADVVSVSGDNLDQARGSGMRLIRVARATSIGLHFSGTWRPPASKMPTADPRVRQALSLAIDRGLILKQLLGGQGSLPVTPYNTVPATSDISVANYAPWTNQLRQQNLARARELLSQAGYPNGFSGLKIFAHTQGGLFLPQVVQVIVSEWKSIGVNATIVPIQFATLRPHILRADPNDGFAAGDAYLIGAGPRFGAVDALDTTFENNGGVLQLLNDPALDKLIGSISAIRNSKARTKAVSKAYNLADATWTAIPMFDVSAIYAANPKTTGVWKRLYPAWAYLGFMYENIQKPKR